MESCEGNSDKNLMISGFSNTELFLDRAFVSFPGAVDRNLL